MKIAIMTWYTDINYGSLLQAFALSSVLRQKGTVDIIDYHPTRSTLVKLSKKDKIIQKVANKINSILNPNIICILRAPAVADALTTGRGAVIERSAGGAGQDCL